MVRKQFLLAPEQNARLRARALASGAREVDIVREGIDMALKQSQTDGDAWKASLDAGRRNLGRPRRSR